MIATTKYFILFISLLAFQSMTAQLAGPDCAKELKPPKYRELFHDYVDKQQKDILRSDGRSDNEFRTSGDDDINYYLTKAVVHSVDCIQYRIEKDSTLNDQVKKKYLRGLENLLKYFVANWKMRVVNPTELPQVLDSYEKGMRRVIRGESVEDIVAGLSYGAGLNLMGAKIFDDNPGFKSCQFILLRKYFAIHTDPTTIFLRLRENTEIPFLDSMIKVAAYRSPSTLYDFAAAKNKLAFAIRKVDDPLVRAVSEIASVNSGRWYFPFLDNLMSGKMTRREIDEVKDDSVKYYQLLVKVHLDYRQRALKKDTAYGYWDLEDRMKKKAVEVFVNTINALHDLEDPAVRFKIIQTLNTEELYYLAVASDGIIYTSSFVKGVYPLMMQKANQHGDSVLIKVAFDKYRKFIKMSAGYNTLSHFLASFSEKKNAETLMREFVSNLERSGDLEDGVDVADSYASIYETIKPLADQMLRNVKENYQRCERGNNKRGMVMYNLLTKLFLSADNNNHIDLSKEFRIPPVYNVPFQNLTNDSGRVIIQMFFYNDKAVPGLINSFQRMFSNKTLWKITSNENWMTVNSVKGKPVTIFANKAIAEEDGSDEKTQNALDDYLAKNNLHPTVTIHRGHSYTAPYTIQQMDSASRIVFLGSCGGYQIIHDVLEKANDSHIIASKQIGYTAINEPFFQLLTEKIRNGNNIDWIPFWEELDKKIKVEGFEDYIPPYKNLGAIFIKAYKIAMGSEE
jgi:hypothetical protein